MSSASPQDITFFIDRCLGKKLATVLRAQGLTVEIHDSHFAKVYRDGSVAAWKDHQNLLDELNSASD